MWFDDATWATIQAGLPVLCVDVLLVDVSAPSPRVGLIRRQTPDSGEKWCLIGGRLRHGERLADGWRRELASALGNSIELGDVNAMPRIVEYALSPSGDGVPYDPRRHAVSVTFAVAAHGTGIATGQEALDFRWFDLPELNSELVGFSQEAVIAQLALDYRSFLSGRQWKPGGTTSSSAQPQLDSTGLAPQ